MIGPSGESAITVRKDNLREKLKLNRDKHEADFQGAMTGYRLAMIRELERMLASAKEGKSVPHKIELDRPQSHTKDYDRVITMLEMCVNDEIVIIDSEFNCYVMDDWGWKTQFQTSVMNYGGLHAQTVRA